MAALPVLNDPSAAAWPICVGPSRPAATILRFPRPDIRRRSPTPVACDPTEGCFARPPIVSHEIAASWLIVLGLALVGFVLF